MRFHDFANNWSSITSSQLNLILIAHQQVSKSCVCCWTPVSNLDWHFIRSSAWWYYLPWSNHLHLGTASSAPTHTCLRSRALDFVLRYSASSVELGVICFFENASSFIDICIHAYIHWDSSWTFVPYLLLCSIGSLISCFMIVHSAIGQSCRDHILELVSSHWWLSWSWSCGMAISSSYSMILAFFCL